jgi:uncharacterized membrane protein YkvI
MLFSHRSGFHSYEQLNVYLFGRKFGKIINLFFLMILLGTTSVMVAGTGSIFQEQLGWPSLLGVFIILFVCFFTVLKGLSGVFAANVLVVPIMLSFSFLVASFTLGTAPVESIERVAAFSSGSGWFFSAMTYASFNLATAQAVLVPLGKEINDEKALKLGGWWGGIGLTMILLMSFLVLVQLPDVFRYDIPMAEMVRVLGPFLHTFYVLVIFGEIFTTVIGNVFGLSRQIGDWLRLPVSVIVAIILAACFVISRVDFSVLLSNLYRLFGMIGFLVLVSLIIRALPPKKAP